MSHFIFPPFWEMNRALKNYYKLRIIPESKLQISHLMLVEGPTVGLSPGRIMVGLSLSLSSLLKLVLPVVIKKILKKKWFK